MTIKLSILFLCAMLGTATGYLVTLSYRNNARYLSELCGAVSELKRNMSYRRDSVIKVLGGVKCEDKLLLRQIREYTEYASGKDGEPAISRGFLSSELYGKVCEFFRMLGGSDGNGQARELDEFGSVFDKLSAAAEQKYKKYGAVAVKLGFLFGLGAGVLTL